MENASKALIIAGAILISILLISVGIIVMNSMNKPIDQAAGTADSQAVEMFNARFTSYAGAGQKAQSIKSLCTAVVSSNGADSHKITIFYKAKSAANFEEMTPNKVQISIDTKHTYDVDLLYADKDGKASGNGIEIEGLEKGYIGVITIEEK